MKQEKEIELSHSLVEEGEKYYFGRGVKRNYKTAYNKQQKRIYNCYININSWNIFRSIFCKQYTRKSKK